MKVFIIEDSDLMSTRISQAASNVHGIEITGHADRVSGTLDRISALLPDTLIVDIHLPDGSGLNILTQFKSIHPHTKALVLSNSSTAAYRQAAHSAGADFFLDKSTEFDQVGKVLSHWQSLLPQSSASLQEHHHE